MYAHLPGRIFIDMRRDAFYSVHPAVSFAFFAAVLLITALVLHPIVTGISLIAACVYTVYIKGRRALPFLFGAVLPLIIAVAVMNPLFNHAGVTPLFCLWNGNAVTLEAIVYGAVSACMFAALVLWCACLNSVMSSDKYVHLFGGVIPSLSLMFSMVLRFVPRFVTRIGEISDAQTGVSAPTGRNPVKAVKKGLSVISAAVTWALEGAVTSSDSMKSRGYGLRGRTSFSLYRFEKRDAFLSVWLVAAAGACAVSAITKAVRFRFYPSILMSPVSALSVTGVAAFLLLAAMPMLLNAYEEIRWQALKSAI